MHHLTWCWCTWNSLKCSTALCAVYLEQKSPRCQSKTEIHLFSCIKNGSNFHETVDKSLWTSPEVRFTKLDAFRISSYSFVYALKCCFHLTDFYKTEHCWMELCWYPLSQISLKSVNKLGGLWIRIYLHPQVKYGCHKMILTKCTMVWQLQVIPVPNFMKADCH